MNSFILFIIGPIFSQSPCPKTLERKEILSLTNEEFTKYVEAAKKVATNGRGRYYAQTYFKYKGNHTEQFLPFSRMLLKEYETDLQKQDPSVTLPFWDWVKDSEQPQASKVLSPEYFGGNGKKENAALEEGKFAKLPLTVPIAHELTRSFQFEASMDPFPSSADLDNYVAFNDIVKFTDAMVYTNKVIKTGLGGDISSEYAPNDPLHFLIAANIDRLWSEWRAKNPNEVQYTGLSAESKASEKDQVSPFRKSVKDVLDINASPLCYKYAGSDASISVDPNPIKAQIEAKVRDLGNNPVPDQNKAPAAGAPVAPTPGSKLADGNAPKPVDGNVPKLADGNAAKSQEDKTLSITQRTASSMLTEALKNKKQ